MGSMLTRLFALKFRKRRRYQAKSGLYVVPENSYGKNQIGDIGMGGLSFYYVDSGLVFHKKQYALTLMADGTKSGVKVSCTTVSDAEAGESVFQNQRIKRRSVRFERMSLQQKRKLRRLIRDYTTGR